MVLIFFASVGAALLFLISVACKAVSAVVESVIEMVDVWIVFAIVTALLFLFAAFASGQLLTFILCIIAIAVIIGILIYFLSFLEGLLELLVYFLEWIYMVIQQLGETCEKKVMSLLEFINKKITTV